MKKNLWASNLLWFVCGLIIFFVGSAGISPLFVWQSLLDFLSDPLAIIAPIAHPAFFGGLVVIGGIAMAYYGLKLFWLGIKWLIERWAMKRMFKELDDDHDKYRGGGGAMM